jgi:crotonobetainyl-CoA:carnitine CoA-transferase CaiB-like acyl-CoA transferase
MIVETEHERFGVVRSLASPVHVGKRRIDHRKAPRLGEDAAYVLSELLGYRAETIERLAREGAIDASVVPRGTVGLEAAGGE